MALTKQQTVNIMKQLKAVETNYYTGDEIGEFLSYGVNKAGTELYVPDTNEGQTVTVTIFEQKGGEGEGEHMHVVFGFKEHPDQYWKLDGSYNSWDSNDWDVAEDIYEVAPEIVPTVIYKRVK